MAIIVPIGVDTKGLVRGLSGAQGKLSRFGKVAAFAAGAAAFGGLVKTLQIGVAEFSEQQKVAAQTEAVLKSTGGVAKVTAQEIATLSEELMRKSGIDDEAIQSGQNLLATFTNIRNEAGKNNDIFNQATAATLDLSVAMGKDMQSSAILVGKALNDPVKGATALSRAGVQLSKSQKDQIKAFMDSGRVLDAQKIILKELNTQFGGSAEAAGKTLPGQLNILKQTFSNLAGELAASFLPSVADAATALVDFLGDFAEQPTLTAKIKFVVSKIGEIAWTGVEALRSWWFREAGKTELPARVVLIAPGGKQQLEKIIASLKPTSERLGRETGAAYANAVLGTSRSELGGKFNPTIVRVLRAAIDPINTTGRFLGQNLIGPFLKGFAPYDIRVAKAIGRGILNAVSEAVPASKDLALRIAIAIESNLRTFLFEKLPNALRDALNNAWESVKGLAESIGQQAANAASGGNPKARSAAISNMKKITNAVVIESIQSARRSLQSLGGEILSFLSEIRASTITVPGGRTPADILKEQRRIEDERLRIEEESLRAALAEAEDKTQAQLDLDEFLLNKEMTMRDRLLEDQRRTDQAAVDSLIDRFNQGLISAEQFYAELEGIIGPDQGAALGSSLGEAFKNRFVDVIEEVKSLVASIFGFAGVTIPIAPNQVPNLAGDAQAAYDADLAEWKRRYANRKQQAEDHRKTEASDEGEKITPSERREINEIMRKWEKQNPRPKKSAYGLALGGILKKTVFAAGEAGPEAVIPLQSQAAWNMLRDAAMASGGGGRGGGDIYLTVNAGLGTNPDELGRVIVDTIKRYERRNGQVFSGPLVPVTATARGVTTTSSGATDFNRLIQARRG